MLFVSLMLAAATPGDVLHTARQAYASCLGNYTRDAMDKKMARAEFLAGLKTKCTQQEGSFRTALIAADKVDGMSDADAADDADNQISGYYDKMTEDFDSAA